MNLGLYVDAHLGLAGVARAAEEAGLSHLWVYDSPLVFGDTAMACLVAAQATRHINVGPGVSSPGQRPPEYTAQMIATLSVAAPGRVMLGLGIGNSARRALGMRPTPLHELREHARIVREMLSGGEADAGTEDAPRVVRFIHPRGRWIDVSHHVPVWISAFGPKALAVAGEVGDGVLVRWAGPEALAAGQAAVRDAAQRAGRSDRVTAGVVYAVQPIASDDELETDAMRAALGPLVISRLRYHTANARSADEVPPAFRDGFVAYRRHQESLEPRVRHVDNYRGYLVFTPTDLESFVTPQSMRSVALVGPPGRIAEELDAMAHAGVDHCSLQMAGDQEAWCRRMAREVFPLVSSRVEVGATAVGAER